MSALPASQKTWTVDEYLAFERSSAEKHEFFQGEIFAMAGASREHNLIVSNINAELRNLLRKRPYEVYPSDMRIMIPATGLYTYPDVSVVCGGPLFDDDQNDTLLNPQVIFEVLSENTERYDRGKKFENYRSIPSLAEYVLVSQDAILVEHYARQPDGAWLLREFRQGSKLALAAIGCEIAVDEIYLKVFQAQPPA